MRVANEEVDVASRSANDLLIYLGEHIGIVGATGTGKTVMVTQGLLPYLQEMYPHVPRYIVDSTGDPDMESLIPDGLFIEGDNPPDILQSSERTLVWTPRHSKIPKEYAEFFNKLIDARAPCIVVIDEIASMTRQALLELETLFKQLRKHGGTVIGESQRIAKVDSDIFSQLSHFFLFNINPEPYDLFQARAYMNMSKDDFRLPSNKHGFWYRKTRGDFPAKEFVDYHQFFNRHTRRFDEWQSHNPEI